MRFLFQVLIIFTLFLASFVHANESFVNKNFEVKLKPLGSYVIISFELKNNAKFYWKNPGELGLPTKFSFDKSSNLKEAKLFWPIPKIYEKDGVASYIYNQKTDFVVRLIPIKPNQIVDLVVEMSFSICQQGCSNYNFLLSTKTNASEDIISDEVIESLAKTPKPNGYESLTIEKVEQEVVGNQHWLNIEFNTDKILLAPKVFLDLPNYVSFEPASFSFISSKNKQVIRIPFKINDKNFSYIKDEIYVVLVAENGIAVDKSSIPVILDINQQNSGFVWILLTALIGGLVLNIMPCVLPVLGLKLLQLIKLSNQNRNIVRRNLIAQSLGIISTFVFFAIITYFLQFLGYQTGLGIHFQQPFYLITMILMLSFIAINLLSDKEKIIHIPQFIIQVFHIKSEQASVLGFFISGILSTLLAIPCAAPFVTIAIGFALTTDFLRMLSIFTLMGIGMSLPYLIMVIIPQIVKFLPKPGPWMMNFKKFVAIAIMATSFWLIYIIYTQLGIRASTIIFLLLLLIKFIIKEKEILSRNSKIFILAILISLAYILPHHLQIEKQYKETIVEQNWHEYNPELIPKLIEQGHIVLVDVGASWCTTCSLNKITTLENDSVINAIKKLKIIAMRADISKETNDAVARLLNNQNHHAVPLTIIYSKKHPSGIKLPTILTPQILISKIKKEL